MGITAPERNFAILESRTHAFELIVAHQYTYYKFYSNMMIAIVWSYLTIGYAQGAYGLAYLICLSFFFLGSRDTLRNYYQRSGQLLGPEEKMPVEK